MTDAARSRDAVFHPSRWSRNSTRERRLDDALNRIVKEGRAEIRQVFKDAKAGQNPASDD